MSGRQWLLGLVPRQQFRVVGVSFDDRQSLIPLLQKGEGELEPERAGRGAAKLSSCARNLLEQLALPRPEPRFCTSRRGFPCFIPCLPRVQTKQWLA